MKYILLVSLLLGCLFHSLIGQDDCYFKLRNDGKALFAKNKYDSALKKYLAALNCDQINQVEIAKLITKAQRAREEELIKERTAAEVNALNAQSILENKQGKNPSKACDYAFQAWQKDPNNLYSWGNFLEAYYSQVYPWQKQYYANPFAETYYQGSSLTAADLSPDGKVFVTGSADPPIIKLWTRGGEDVLSFLGFTKTISRLHFSPDGTSIAIASLDGKARLLNADGSIKAYLFGHQSSLLDIAFSTDGQRIVTASVDNSAILWNAISGDSVCRLTDPLQSPLRTAQFSRDSKLIITAHADGHANIWDVTGKHLHTLPHGAGIISSAAFFYQGKYCITVSEDKIAKLFTSSISTSGLGITIDYDNRDNFFSPKSGYFYQLNHLIYDDAIGSDINYQLTEFSGLNYIKLTNKWRTGIRLAFNYADSDELLPPYALPSLSLRGVPSGRYQGNAVAVTELELVYQVSLRWQVNLFGGVGRVASDISGLKDDSSKVSKGVGFRYLMARRYGFDMGIDIAHGPEDTVFYIQAGSAW